MRAVPPVSKLLDRRYRESRRLKASTPRVAFPMPKVQIPLVHAGLMASA
jgi:hypothetical protein